MSVLITKRNPNSSMVVYLDVEATEHLRRLPCKGLSILLKSFSVVIYIATKSANLTGD